MTREQILRILAGTMVLLSLGLGVAGSPIFHHANWLWLTAFVGLNLFQSGFTRFCLPEVMLKKFNIGKPCNWSGE